MQLVNRLSASDREETGAELMRKYDKDKDGSFSIDEVAVIVSDVQKERRAKKNYKKDGVPPRRDCVVRARRQRRPHGGGRASDAAN